ncbi:MAG: NADH-quinone oxidoreductase subunit L [Gemmatimonadaceae bacterium]|nr:NADH-quinone oxidoreductase subunit L [Gemmatimonadaceae bacterium]
MAQTALAHPLSGSSARLVGLIPLLPLLGAVINGLIALTARRSVAAGDSEAVPSSTTANNVLVSIVGPGVVLAAFALALVIFRTMLSAGAMPSPYIVSYGQWMPVASFVVDWSLQLDQLSMLMVLVVTGIGSLIHLFSIGYMRADAGYARYFAYLNLFVSFMLVLVLGASYPVLFVGWEGVGLCSYLLIGFWFSDRVNVEAGKKAFVVNRIGDFGFLVAMFLMWSTVQHLDFAGAHAALAPLAGSPVVLSIALFLFLGCVGKSAQIPLYVWLPDAMAGPTPVSALIHAATMVTAGVYLVARAAPIFAGAPEASLLVTVVGAVTALFAATIALRQWDIKKVLAYSTVSQLGYMFMAVGSGAYTAGVFHLVTHAFFKALLFLGAGSVIHAMHAAFHHTHRDDDPQDLRNMGGLARVMPATAIAMMLATLAIAGVPPLSGFFSKDEILSSVFARAQGSPLAGTSLLGISGSAVLYAVYGIGLLTALLTAVYMTRMMMMAFLGTNRTGTAEQSALHEAPAIMTAPVLVLALLTVVGGWLNLPALIALGPTQLLEHWLAPVTGASSTALAGTTHLSHNIEVQLVAVAIGVAVVGIAFAVVRYRGPSPDKQHAPAEQGVSGLLTNAYGIDGLLDTLVVRPLQFVANSVLTRGVDVGVDRSLSAGGTLLTRTAAFVGSRLQDGDVGKYAWMIAAGVIVVLAALSLR